MSTRIYPKVLSKFITKYPYIPKVIKYKDDIKQFARYYCLESSIGFKVDEVIEVSHQLYYQIKFLDTNRQAVIPYEEKFHYYELLTDKSDIYLIDSIINSPQPYYGSEIKYWFFTHNINLDAKQYQEFKPLLLKSDKVLIDKKVYFLKADYNRKTGIYTNCRAILCKDFDY